MAKKCVPCISQDIKDIISEKLGDPRMNQLLESIKTCDTDLTIELCGKKARPRSAYQEHTAVCMRAGKTMKQCSIEWRAKKG